MKRIFILVALMIAMLGVAVATAQEGATFTDTNGLYVVPVPTNWTATETEKYALLESPSSTIKGYLLVNGETDLEDALVAAWAVIDPEFPATDYTVRQIQRIDDATLLDGFSQAIVITYNAGTGEGQRITQGIALALDGLAYVVIFDGGLTAFQQLNAQVQQIFTGFKPAALVRVDLTDTPALPFNDDMATSLETFVARLQETLGEQGVAVVILQDGEVAYEKAFGTRNPEGDALTLDTHMMIGSVTKTMTTLVMAGLVDEGLLDWDAPARTYMPQFAVKDAELSEAITVENLVCACTGVPRRDLEFIFNADELTAQDTVEALQTFDFFTDFGVAFQYSNQLVATAGYLAAMAHGGTYENLYDDYIAMMNERLFAPAGMTRTTFSLEDVAADSDYAIPYGLLLDGSYAPLPIEAERVLDSVMPAGTVWSTPRDMTTYLALMLEQGVTENGTTLVSAENLARLWKAQVPITADVSYGLGWILEKYRGVEIIGHGGNTLGFSSDMIMLPSINLGILVMTNQQASSMPALIRQRVLELVYAQPDTADATLGFMLAERDKNLAEGLPYLQETVDEDLIANHVGTFRNAELGTIIIRATEDGYEADTGEFTAPIWQRNPIPDTEQKTPALLLASPPLSGTELKLSTYVNGTPIITIGIGVVEYVFTKE